MCNFFTSESVTEGHPDKICDRISDAVLDALLAQDPGARVACETMVKDNQVWLLGEVTATANVDYARIARETIRWIGYTEACGFDPDTCEITVVLREQSPDIALGVDRALESKNGAAQQLGAGDQGMMFGYACDETPELMPLSISLAHKLSRALATARKSGQLPYLRPDGKSQVTVEYRNDQPVRIDTVVVSAQHDPDVDIEVLRRDVKSTVILPTLPSTLVDAETKFYINPTGRFVTGGPVGDSGLTGRKIIVDTYGGYGRHGGGSFSGKDPTKVDRSAAYMARYAAKNIVAAGLASKCEIQLAYAIGVAQPVSVFVETFGTATIEPVYIEQAIAQLFDFRPSSIIEQLRLRETCYAPLAAYGHVGRDDLQLAWEQTDRAAQLRATALAFAAQNVEASMAAADLVR